MLGAGNAQIGCDDASFCFPPDAVYDVQMYTFSRQSRLLFAMETPLIGTRRAYHFITSFGRAIGANEVQCPLLMKRAFFV